MNELIESWSTRMPAWAWNTAVIGLVLILGFIGKMIIARLLRHYKRQTDYSVIRSIVCHLNRPFNHFVPLLTLSLVLPFLTLKDVYETKIERVLGILLVISFTSVLISSIKILEDYVYHKYDLNKDDNLKERKVRTQLQFIRRLTIVMIILIAVSIILLSFESVRKLGTGLLTGVGIGGVIIGFAAQKSLGNLLAGFQIAFTQPIRIDDVLVVEGEWGRVEDITLTYVVLNIWDQRRLILPINYFIEKPFQNWTRTTSEILGTVFLYVDHTAPADKMREELMRLLNASPLWDKRVGVLQVTDTKETVIEIRCLMSARNSSQAFDLRCYVRENMVAYLKDNYPQSLPKRRLDVDGGDIARSV
ncbi:mechanosensitive ion channel family protein [Mucilaginibacter myungsuensis]|uniref:Mechanosensitive ion channel n=1 Tax=Mucilaginibacter myungsuensis TaxID=649104 RepID=A0A929L4U3_9SPHI|nr:mechanosensitive ion channel domain-containing protein [Mucilaginibacter myungsuensis]MBE9664484.1 mechanosensitive ion channel [Mucilaginibacter myungsuensis]MDN3601371.1 mechanosensitive ion channel [Mucilaginibacter myungsuensis]